MPPRGYKCLFCPSRFKTMPEWATHSIKEIEATNRTDCVVCLKSFSNTTNLTKHIVDRVCHKRLPRYVCPYCDGRTGSASKLIVHKKYECTLGIEYIECDTLFSEAQCIELDRVWLELNI